MKHKRNFQAWVQLSPLHLQHLKGGSAQGGKNREADIDPTRP